MSRTRRVHVYALEWQPGTTGDGTRAGIFSDVRAYLDLGWDVEYVCMTTQSRIEWPADPALERVRWTQVHVQPAPCAHRAIQRVAYWTGWPPALWLPYRFPASNTVRREVARRRAEDPLALHQFEYNAVGAAAATVTDLRSILRLHDIESDFARKHQSVRAAEGRTVARGAARGLRRLQRAERLIARRARAVFCYGSQEAAVVRDTWGCAHARYLPISWPDERAVARTRAWLEGGRLRLLHVGRVDSLPSFRSLEFLLGQVFPRLEPSLLNRLEMLVVGEVRDSARARTIQEMAARFPCVRLLGVQPDLRPVYGQVDLHVVGSTEATGLRTRIIESLAFGVPVVSTEAGALGMEGGPSVRIAADAAAFAGELQRLSASAEALAQLAAAGRHHYASVFGRGAIAARLDTLLKERFA